MAGTIVGQILRAIGLGGRSISIGSVTGPASYLAGGFTYITGLSTVTGFVASPRMPSILEVNDAVYDAPVTISGGTLTITINTMATASPAGWAQIANAVNCAGTTWDVIAIGY